MTRRKAGYVGKGPTSDNVESTGVWDINQAGSQVSRDLWPNMANNDPYAEYVTLAIEADGKSGTNIFVDKSGRNHFVNTSGGVSISSTEKKTGNGSAIFDGNGEQIYVPHSTDVHLSSDFTVEFYFKVSTLKGYQGFLSKQHDAGDARAFLIIFETSNRITLYCGNNGAWTIALDTGFQPVVGNWYHFVCMRKEDQWGVYIDGVLIARTVSVFAPSIGSAIRPLQIGRYDQATQNVTDFGGYIDAVRITDGVARYMPSFTAPTAAFGDNAITDPYYNNVELLLHMNGSNGSTTFTDSSKNAFITTPRGGLALTTAESKFGGSSARFNRASSQFLDIPVTGNTVNPINALNLGRGDFTLEAWINLNTYPSAGGYSSAYWIVGGGGASVDAGIEWYVEPTQIKFNISAFSSSTLIGYHGFALNTWYHVAVVRQGNGFYMYVNGECIAIGFSTASAATLVNGFAIAAAEPTGGSTAGNFDGWIDELRITKNVARYPGNFTPPTKYIRTIPAKSGDPYFNNVNLLLHMEGTEGGTTFTDSSPCSTWATSTGGNLSFTANGNAKLSTAQSKFGGSSALFDGSGDYLSANTVAGLLYQGANFGTAPFTVEAWVRLNAQGNYNIASNYGSSTTGWAITIDTDYRVKVNLSGDAYDISGTTVLQANIWYHVALSGASGGIRLFVNGVQEGSTFTGSVALDSTAALTIGGLFTGGVLYYAMNGYIDDLRITRGVSRYSSNFTPPTDAHPTTIAGDPYFYNVTVLLPMNGPNNSTTFNSLGGNAVTATNIKKFGTSSTYFNGYTSAIGFEYSPWFGLSTSDFTVEGWFYFTDLTQTYRHLISLGDGVNGSGPVYCGWALAYRGTESPAGQLVWRRYDGTDTLYNTTGLSLTANTWYHIAVCRINGILQILVDGVPYFTGNVTTNYDAVNNNRLWLGLGHFGPGSGYTTPRYWAGYMDEIRISKGVGRYPTRFVSPTNTFTSDANTSLLLRMDGDDDSIVFTDSSSNALAVTPFADAKISINESKFDGSSGYFDGTADYLSIANTSVLNFGTDDFTVEAWINLKAYGTYAPIFSNAYLFYIGASGQVLASNGASDILTSPNGAISLNRWHYVAWVRNGSVLSCYVDGIRRASATVTASIGSGSPNYVGRWSTVYLNGYIDNLRVSNIARYTNASFAFTPPTSAFLDYYRPTSDPYGPKVALLMRGDGKQQSPMTRDSSPHMLSLSPGGTPTNEVRLKKFGSASLRFNASSEYGIWPSQALSFSNYSGDFTIEFWINLLGRAQNTGGVWVLSQTVAGNYTPILLHISTSSTLLQLYTSTTGSSWTPANAHNVATLTRHAWNHIAFCRNNGYLTVFVNGVPGTLVQIGTSALMTTTNPWYIGSGNTGVTYLNGCFDDLRITKGVSRYYSANFTPATSAFTDPTYSLSEPLADKTVALLHMGNTGDPNTTFDSSTYNFTPLLYGNAKISTTQSKFGGSSLFVDGTNSYLEIGYEYPFTIGTNDFTIELWVYPLSTRTVSGFVSASYAGSGVISFVLAFCNDLNFNSGSNVLFGYYNGSSWSGVTSTEGVTANEWSHIAVNRRNNVITIYKNGTCIGASTFSTSLPIGTGQLWLGRRWDASGTNPWFDGYMDEFRFTNGAARYGQAITVPTIPFTSDSFTSLLLHADGINGSTAFIDSSSNLIALNVIGNASLSTAQSKFGTSSIYFDGSGDYLTATGSLPFNFGTGDFTVEMWVYPLSYGGTTGGATLFGTTFGAQTGYSLNLGEDISNFRIISNASGAWANDLTAGTGNGPALNTWTHIAWVRKGASMLLFKDGNLVAAGNAYSAYNYGNPNNFAVIGRFFDGTTTRDFNGYIDELRVSKGIARYNTNFTPPTAPFTDPVITRSEPLADKVSLLLHMNGSNGAKTMIDSSPNATRIDVLGTAQISTAQSKFGGSSAYFDGTSSLLELFPGSSLAFGSDSFTIETWIRLDSLPSVWYIIDSRNTSQTSNWAIIYSAGGLNWFNGTTETIRTWYPVVNTWYHIALVRTSTVCQFYVDGIPLGAPISDSTNFTVAPVSSYIGSRYTGTDKFPGYMDEFRITRAARYPENFTPPTTAHPTP